MIEKKMVILRGFESKREGSKTLLQTHWNEEEYSLKTENGGLFIGPTKQLWRFGSQCVGG